MKLDLFLVPSSEVVSSKKLIVKKLFSTLVTTLVVGGATLLFGAAERKPSLERLATVGAETDSEAVIKVPLGLSRRRGAFNKAVNMLADGAAANPLLAGYYNSVAKRVKGKKAGGDNSSGVQVVRSERKIDTIPVDTMTIERRAIADLRPQAVPEGLVALLQDVAKLAKTVVKPTANRIEPVPTSDEDSSSPAEGAHANSGRFTVGDMAFDTNPPIEHWMNYYTATPIGRMTMKIGIGRSNSYLEMARAEFRSAGVPEDLVWLAFVESVWNPQAVSPAAAGGIWQFIPATATDYGLTVESGNDERADPLKQTRVAAIYLHDLYTVFGDWALAMAAYNSGEPRVMGAVVKNGRANFWDLYDKQLLPKETLDYVPKILAAIKIASLPENYGFSTQAETGIAVGS